MAADDKVLFALDFDNTLVDENTDTWVLQILPHLELKDKLHEYKGKFDCWTDLMNEMLKILHDNGCGREEIIDWIKKIKPFEAMESFLKKAKDNPLVDVVIISDSNTIFISTILKQRPECLTAVDEIHTNRGVFDSTGRLHVTRYHAHSCPHCTTTPNMCKGIVLKAILGRHKYSQVVYVGDGRNDMCPCVSVLNEGDHVIARKDYPLAKKLQDPSSEPIKAALTVLDFADKSTEKVLCNLMSRLTER